MNITKTPAPAGNFIALLQGKTGGVALVQLDEALAELVQRTQETGRKGSLTYKIVVQPNAKKGVRIDDHLDVKLPKEEAGASFFFVGPAGALLRNDPNQRELELKVVPTEPAQPIKVVNS